MKSFYRVTKGKVLYNQRTVSPGGFIYASPEEMSNALGYGSVVLVDKNEVSYSFLKDNGFLKDEEALNTTSELKQINNNPESITQQQKNVEVIADNPNRDIIQDPDITSNQNKSKTPKEKSSNNEVDLGLDSGVSTKVSNRRSRS